jgi:hypothetical protein
MLHQLSLQTFHRVSVLSVNLFHTVDITLAQGWRAARGTAEATGDDTDATRTQEQLLPNKVPFGPWTVRHTFTVRRASHLWARVSKGVKASVLVPHEGYLHAGCLRGSPRRGWPYDIPQLR